MRNIVALSLFVALLTGCATGYGDFGSAFNPRPFLMRNTPSGDDAYSQGWRDGCQSITGVVSEGFVRGNEFAYDAERGVYDNKYYKGWRDGLSYCNYYTDYDPI
jgi:hypothetical protein